MRLRDTLNYFAKQQISDAYSGLDIFKGHFDIYDGSVRDSLTGGRRTLTIAPDSQLPDRLVIKYKEELFIAGDEITDSFKGDILKKHIVLHPVDGLAKVVTSAQALTGIGGTYVYAARSWRKTHKEELESSEMFNLFNFYVAKGESGERNSLVLLDGRYYRIQGSEDTTGGFVILVASELEADTVQTVSYTPASGIYDPVSDSHAVSASLTIQALWERHQTSYRYTKPSSVKFKPGDIMLTFTSADIASPKTGDNVTIKGVDYLLLSAVDDGAGSWESHLRGV